MSKLQELENGFFQGKMSRRDFIAQVSALGLMAAVSPGLLSTSAHASTPKKGGRFRQGWSTGNISDSLDPATQMDNWIFGLAWQLRNNLVEIDHNGNAIPELAEKIESSPDAKEWYFSLRKGVEFHNGKSFGAKDVIFTLNRHRGEKSKSGAKGLLKAVKDIRADGNYMVIFTLDGGNADFPYILADYHFEIGPEGTEGKEWDEGIGTGPYILVDWEPGIRALTRRNPNYWKEGRAHFDEVETFNIQDVNARTNALTTKQIDYMNRCDLKTAHMLINNPDIQIITASGPFHHTMPMNTQVAPYDNNDVRLALKYAIDREQLVDKLLRGYGYVGNDHPIGKNQKFYAAELPQREYDPEKAKYYLKKAGLENHSFDLYTTDLGDWDDNALLYKENAKEAGININLIKKPADGYWSNVWMKVPFCTAHWNGRPTVDMMLSTGYAEDAAWNDTYWKNDRFNKLIEEARAELNENKRYEMYYEAQKIVRDNGGVIAFMFKDYVQAATKKIRYTNIAGNLANDGLRNAERWWFA